MSYNRVNSVVDVVASTFIADDIGPRVVRSALNMSSETLSLWFSEVVYAASLNATAVVLKSTVSGTDVNEVRLTLTSQIATDTGSANSQGQPLSPNHNDTIVRIRLSLFDLNRIKFISGLAESAETSVLQLDRTLIQDVALNPFAPGVFRPVDTFFGDVVSPTVTSVDVDMSENTLTIHCIEVVDVGSVVFSNFLLAKDSTAFVVNGSIVGASNTSQIVRLSGGRAESVSSTSFRVFLSQTDSNAARMLGFGRVRESTVVAVSGGAFRDVSSNEVVPAVLPVTDFVQDVVRPRAFVVHLDMNNKSLRVDFDEIVDPSSVVVTNIRFGSNDSVVVYAITSAVARQVLANSITIDIDNADINELNSRTDVATSAFNTYVTVGFGFVADTSTNANRNDETVLQATFERDQTDPRLVEFSFNLTSGELIMVFDEVMNSSSLRPSQLTLQSTQTGGSSVTLSQAAVLSGIGLTVRLTLSVAELNTIKADLGMYTNRSTSFLSITGTAVQDVAGNYATAVPSSDAMQARVFYSDFIRPTVDAFDLNMTSAILTLEFVEVMDESSVDFNSIALQTQPATGSLASLQHRLTNGCEVVPTPELTRVQIRLSQADTDAMKVKGIGLTNDSTWLVVDETAITDNNGLYIVPRIDGVNALGVRAFARDVINPTVVSFGIDLTAEQMVIVFSEAVNPGTIDPSAITVFDAQRTVSHALSAASRVSGSAGPIIYIRLAELDLNAMKIQQTMAVSRESTVIAFGAGTLGADFNGNPVEGEAGMAAQTFIQDRVPADLRSVSIDFNSTISETRSVHVGSAKMIFVFNEPVFVNSSDGTAITIQGSQNGATTESVRLTGFFETVSRDNGTMLVFNLLRHDVNALKLLEKVATSKNNTFVAVDSSFIVDLNGNPVNSVPTTNALQVTQYTTDGIKPQILSFTFDLNIGQMTILFDEPVRNTSIRIDELTLRDTSDPSVQTANVTLNGGVFGGQIWLSQSTAGPSMGNSDTITFSFLGADLNEIKRLGVCSKDETCYVVHTEFLAADMVIDETGYYANLIERCT
jgi:hypothetical protein